MKRRTRRTMRKTVALFLAAGIAGIAMTGDVQASSEEIISTESTGTDSQAYADAKECYETLLGYKDAYLEENFASAQETDNYDGNNERYYVNPANQENLPEEFNETALSLEEGEIGMTDATDYGYFIIMRLAFDTDDLTNIKNDMINEAFNAELTELAGKAEIEEMDVLTELDYTSYMERLDTLQTTITDEYRSLSQEMDDAMEIEGALLEKLPEEAKTDCVAYLTDGVLDKDTVVMTVNGNEIKAGVFFYMLNYYKNTDYGTGIISESYLTIAMNQAKADLVNDVIARQLAADQGTELSEEEAASNEEVLENTLTSSLLYLGCNEDALQQLLDYTSYGNAYAAEMYGEGGEKDIPLEDVYAYAEENQYYTCEYIWYYE